MNRRPTDRLAEAVEQDELTIELLRRMARKDRDALHAFYQPYARRMGNFLMKLLKQPELVDEAVNDALLAIWQCAGEFDPAKGKVSTWLFGIAYNKGLKALERTRKHQDEQSLYVDSGDDADGEWDILADAQEQRASFNPERTVLGWELGDIFKRALEHLSAEHRTVLELTFADGYSYQEIADITNCPINTVKTRIFHARKNLFQFMEKYGYSPATYTHEAGL
jgi:RNA polymerase sigma-70 factor (ECF subfamily)